MLTVPKMLSNVNLYEGYIESLLDSFSNWQNTTTIIKSGSTIFEFKGVFPKGALAKGYYNLSSEPSGFCGHIHLPSIRSITLQEKNHRAKASYAFCFLDKYQQCVFKVFLGRDENGVIYPDQLEKFEKIKSELQVLNMV